MIELIFIFIFGLFVGSFLNCVAWRIFKEETFVVGRSYCPSCRHVLSSMDLVPVVSFVFLKGKCRYCKENISYQYPLMEILTGSLFVSLYQYLNISSVFSSYSFAELLFWWTIGSLLLIAFIYDLRHFMIPDRITFGAIILTVIFILSSFALGVYTQGQVINYFFSAFGSAFFFFILWFITMGKGMGFGDVKLGFLIGLLLGWPKTVIGLFLSFVIGAIIGIILILLKRKGMKSEVPFGPFLVLGTFLGLFYGQSIINWFFSLTFKLW